MIQVLPFRIDKTCRFQLLQSHSFLPKYLLVQQALLPLLIHFFLFYHNPAWILTISKDLAIIVNKKIFKEIYMKISVTRNTGWLGFASRLKVFINGVEVTRIASSKTDFLDIPLPEGNAAILTIKSIRSSNLEVKDGDQVLIETNPTYTTFFCGCSRFALHKHPIATLLDHAFHPCIIFSICLSYRDFLFSAVQTQQNQPTLKNSPSDCFFVSFPV